MVVRDDMKIYIRFLLILKFRRNVDFGAFNRVSAAGVESKINRFRLRLHLLLTHKQVKNFNDFFL